MRHGQMRALPSWASVCVHRRTRVQLLGSEEYSGVDVDGMPNEKKRHAARGGAGLGELLWLPAANNERGIASA